MPARLYLAAPKAQSSRNGGAVRRHGRQLSRGVIACPAGHTDPSEQDRGTGQQQEQEDINTGSSAPGSH